MALQNSYPFSTDFADNTGSFAPGMQANNITTDATSSPTGIAGHIEIINNTYKSSIFSTDPQTLGGIRSELYFTPSAVANENWYTWEMLINQVDWDNGSTGNCSVMQIHNKDSINAAVNFLLMVQKDGNGSFQFVAYIPSVDPPSLSTVYKQVAIPGFTFGKWHKFCLHSLWKADNTGWMDLIIDGVMVMRIFLYGTAYTSDAPYPKLGTYDANHSNVFGASRIVYYRNLYIWQGTGDSYEDVLVLAPRPQNSKLM